MPSVNKVIVMGNLGRDPEVRFTAGGSAVCTLSIATTRSWKNKESGEKVEETEWHRVVLYDRLAEIAGEYLRKGRAVYIEGRLKTRKWKDKEQIERYTTEIVAESMQLMGAGADAAPNGAGAPAPAPTQAARPTPPPPPPASSSGVVRSSTRAPVYSDSFDQDIPF